MIDYIFRFFEFMSALIGIMLVAFFLYVIFIMGPVVFYTDAECLRKGFPKSEVSIGLERYCMNLDGSVTVNVQKQ